MQYLQTVKANLLDIKYFLWAVHLLTCFCLKCGPYYCFVFVCTVHQWICSQLLPVCHPEKVASIHEHQEHHPQVLRRALQRHFPGHLWEVRYWTVRMRTWCTGWFWSFSRNRLCSRISCYETRCRNSACSPVIIYNGQPTGLNSLCWWDKCLTLFCFF